MCVTDGRGPKVNGNGPYDTYILESDALTGPWKRVTYMKAFGAEAYFVNFPSKFISVDGRTLWVCYSHGWSYKKPNPPNSRYAMCLQEIRLLAPDDPKLTEQVEARTVFTPPTPGHSPSPARGPIQNQMGVTRLPLCNFTHS